jgi:hypothetical protein
LYVVVTFGDTVMEPEAENVPTPLSMVTEVSFVAFQVRVVLEPGVIALGVAVKVKSAELPAESFEEPTTPRQPEI